MRIPDGHENAEEANRHQKSPVDDDRSRWRVAIILEFAIWSELFSQITEDV